MSHRPAELGDQHAAAPLPPPLTHTPGPFPYISALQFSLLFWLVVCLHLHMLHDGCVCSSGQNVAGDAILPLHT